MTSNTVAVVIPAYNSQSTIVRTLQSVEHQTLRPTEVIIVNDNSSDNTVDAISDFAKTSHLNIKVLHTNKNVGPGSARNTGWDNASSDYVAFLDSDDTWHPQKLEIQIREMDKNPEYVMSCHERIVSESHVAHHIDATNIKTRTFDLNDFIVRNRCSTPTVVVRRKIKNRYRSEKRYAEDYLLWMEIAADYCCILFINLPLTTCTNPIYGGKGLSGRFIAMQKGELESFRILKNNMQLRRTKYFYAVTWSSLKFGIRIIDHFLFRGLRQTVSESK
jgi:glycosyltransferase involved in cell wall biosynthesis